MLFKIDFAAFTKILGQLKSTKASKKDEDKLRAAFASLEEGDYNSGFLNIKVRIKKGASASKNVIHFDQSAP